MPHTVQKLTLEEKMKLKTGGKESCGTYTASVKGNSFF